MAPAWQTLAHSPHSPVWKWMQFSRSMTGTRGEAWGWARSMHGRALRYLSKAVRCGLSRREVIVARSTAPVGQTNAQAPHAWHWSVGSSKAVRTSRAAPRPNRLIAPRPIISLHTRAHSPQRMHFPSAAGSKRRGLDAQPGGKLGQLARVGGLGQEQLEDRSPRLLDALGLGVHDEAVFDRVAARGHQLSAARRFDLHQADPARPVGRQPAVVAERRDRDAHLACGIEDRRAARDFRGAAVDGDLNDDPLQFGPWSTPDEGMQNAKCNMQNAKCELKR